MWFGIPKPWCLLESVLWGLGLVPGSIACGLHGSGGVVVIVVMVVVVVVVVGVCVCLCFAYVKGMWREA
jgi:hypothetical protein